MSDSESYEDGADDYGILKKALDVELPEDFDPNKIPETGEEYLQHVMYERTQCKTWLTADIDRSKFRENQTFKIELDVTTEAPKFLLPSSEWQTSKIEDFTNFRKFIRSKLDSDSSVISAFDEEDFIANVVTEPPKFEDVIKYNQAAKIRMLQIISKSVGQLERGASIGENLGSWLYALLVLLEKPLSPSSCHSLREFAKKCRNVRTGLADAETAQLMYEPLNLFICIVGRFFHQLDLADP